jgi:small redox-active disulfide protein 2
MYEVLVLGSGCAKCKRLEAMTSDVINELGVEAALKKVTDFDEIMKFDILSTPALVINNEVVSYGRIPSKEELRAWFSTPIVDM